MKPFFGILFLLTALTTPLFAADADSAPKDDSPLKSCLVSGEPLGGMGDVVHYTYKAEGQPDQEVQFCCKMCIPRFKKNPDKYLAKLNPTATGHSHAHSSDAAAPKDCCAEGECAACAAQEG